MATKSGTFSSYPSISYRIDTVELEVYPATNQSLVRARAYLVVSTGFASSSGGSGDITLPGGDYFWYVGEVSFSGAGELLVAENTWLITHNADGTGSYDFRGSSSMAGWGSAATGDGSGPLSPIDRKPGAPASCTATLNSDRSVTVTAGNAAAPGGLPALTTTYYVQLNRNGEGWTNQQAMSGQSFTYSGLTPGASYQFRVFAYNDNGSSAFTMSSTLTIPSGGKYHDGTNWVNTVGLKYNDGTDGVWRDAIGLKTSTGGAWVDAL